ncbi:Abi family protein [Lachnospiraceae bacterium ASD5720]|uniref:Abi family protein n=1 Tax=Diplocloster agilis TaxID=2850323 RepID=A0A949NHT1_9FIRM|nr:Abi family protein [Diplocloster agilis]
MVSLHTIYHLWIKRQTDKCFDGTTFERLEQIYYFDQKLRVLMIKMWCQSLVALWIEIRHFDGNNQDEYMFFSQNNKKL